MLKLIWLLFFQDGSIWVGWFKETVLSGDLSSFWKIQSSTRNSWLLNKLLKLRGEIYHWIRLRVRSGTSTRFWTDNWSPFGSLQSFLENDSNFSLRIQDDATVSSLYMDNHWILPQPRSDKKLQLHVFLTTLELSLEDDYYEWEVEGKISSKYSTGHVYATFYTQGTSVPWENIVWIAGGIAKHSFLCWLFILNQCPTHDMLLRWGLQTAPSCLLCNSAAESQDHLFLVSFLMELVVSIKSPQ